MMWILSSNALKVGAHSHSHEVLGTDMSNEGIWRLPWKEYEIYYYFPQK